MIVYRSSLEGRHLLLLKHSSVLISECVDAGLALNAIAGRSAPVVLSGVVCSGSESSLAECSRASIGPLEGGDCQDLDVGVICQGEEV